MRKGQVASIPARRNLTGPGSSSLKYDFLTTLLVTAARSEPVEARLALRLSLLVTARFNWRSGTFAVGLREMARMWGVTERTAKREIAALRARGWITLKVPAARGRVAEHRIEIAVVVRATRAHWEAVGPDFVERMTDAPPEPQGNVVPFHPPAGDLPAEDGTGWATAAARLNASDPNLYGSWFAALAPLDLEDGTLTLAAPSRFVAAFVETHHKARLVAAVTSVNRAVRDVRVVAAP
jgi:hypothetical protein